MDNYTLLTIIAGFILVIYYYFVKKYKHWEKYGIPSPKSKVPLLGNMWKFMALQKSLNEIFEELYDSVPGSSMIGVYNFGNPELLIRDPNLVKSILQTNFSAFPMGGLTIDPKKDPLLSLNPFFLKGEEWKKSRSVLTNTMSTAKLRNMALGIQEVCGRFDDYLKQQMIIHNNNYEVQSEDLFSRFTSEVVAKVGFGIDGNSFTNNPGNFRDVAKMIFEPTGFTAFKQTLALLFPPIAKIIDTQFIPKKIDKYLRNVVTEVLEIRKRNNTYGNDFIQQISDSYKSESGQTDDTFVTGHAISFMIDGYLTSSYTLSSIAYHLAILPEVQDKLRKEIKQVLVQHDNKISYECIQDMKYMDLVIQESMRLLPVAPMLTRICAEETKFTGDDGLEYIIRPGERINICISSLQKDPKYVENPEQFNPERFKEDKGELQKYICMPFGAGPKMCVGMRMALLQMKGALATILTNYSFDLSSKTKIPISYETMSFLNIVKGGIWINIKPLK